MITSESHNQDILLLSDSKLVVHKIEVDVQQASIAQWQSTGLVNQGSRVQSSLEAYQQFWTYICRA